MSIRFRFERHSPFDCGSLFAGDEEVAHIIFLKDKRVLRIYAREIHIDLNANPAEAVLE